jgi:glucosyl-dolichyl phosphate glucuronosyltransferase
MVNVSVVVSTYSEDRSMYVHDCIRSLKRQSLLPLEIILVLDAKSSLFDFYRSRFYGDAKVVTSGSFGLSNARNTGAKSARGDVVAFIDDDAVADTDWIKNLVAVYDDPEVVGVGGHIDPIWENGIPVWFPEELNWILGCSYKGLPEQKAYVRNPIGCNMSFRRSIFDLVGYFRTDMGRFGSVLLGSEEPELSLRILNMFPASKIVYEPHAVVYHKVGKSRRKITYLLRRSFYEGFSKALISYHDENGGKGLSTENQYLRYLVNVSIPSKLKRFYTLKNVLQLTAMFLSTSAVLLGFVVGQFTEATAPSSMQAHDSKVNGDKSYVSSSAAKNV